MRPNDLTQTALEDIVARGATALAAVGGDRLRAEWRRVCSEPTPAAVVRWLSDNEVAQALGLSGAPSAVQAVSRLLSSRALGRKVAPEDVLFCWWVAGSSEQDPQAALRALEVFGLQDRHERWVAQREAFSRVVARLEALPADDVLEDLLQDFKTAALSVLVALHPEVAAAVRRYESVVLGMLPLLAGKQLLAAGMDAGPGIGDALRAVRAAQLRGELGSTEEALEFLGLQGA